MDPLCSKPIQFFLFIILSICHRVFTEYFAPLMPSHELHFKCPTHTKTVNQTLAFILRHIVSDTTPPQVSRILLSSLSGFVTQVGYYSVYAVAGWSIKHPQFELSVAVPPKNYVLESHCIFEF